MTRILTFTCVHFKVNLQIVFVFWTGAFFQPGQFSNLGSCPTGAVVTLGQLSTWTVVLPGQLSNLDSCPTWAVVQPGQLLPGQLSAWTVVTWAVVVTPLWALVEFVCQVLLA